MSEDTGTKPEDDGAEGEADESMIDPSTGQPFPDTPEGRADKKAFLTERRDAKHPKGGPPGQSKKSGTGGSEPAGEA
jgi:hypothetical protein